MPELEAPAPESATMDNRTRKKVAMDERKTQRTEQAAKAKALRAMYYAAKDDPVSLNNLKVLREFIEYHQKLAQDGIGYEPSGRVGDDGERIMLTVRLKPEERVAHLDKAAAQQEFLDYLERQLK